MVREQFKRFGRVKPEEVQTSSKTKSSTPLQQLRHWVVQSFVRPKPVNPTAVTTSVKGKPLPGAESRRSQRAGNPVVKDTRGKRAQPKLQPKAQRATHASSSGESVEHVTEPTVRSPQTPPQQPDRSPEGDLPEPTLPRRRKPKSRGGWRWSLLCFAVLGVISGMGSAALLWLVSLPPPPDCEDPARITLDMERLYCAQQAIDAGELPELIAGLDLLKQWTPEDALYPETQKLAEEWSKRVLTIARTKVLNSDLEGALEAISHIPETTPVYADAQRSVEYWQRQWTEGETIAAQAEEAFKTQNWTLASQKIAEMADLANPYWYDKRANELAQQLGVERRSRQLLIQAQSTAAEGSLRSLGQAITQAQDVTQGTFAWEDARNLFRQWSQTLLSDAIQKWEAGDLTGAVNTLRLAKVKTTVPELQDLSRFSNAYQLASQSFLGDRPAANWFPSVQQLWSLREALFAMRQISVGSPFYEQAQTIHANFQSQWDDLVQLHYASLTANFGQHAFLQIAIDQAQQVEPDRPRRLQAQTLIAYWQEQIQQIEDQPYLDQAIALAKGGRIADLQLAIAEASRIQQGRALRLTAQGQIAAWRQQIETIEDKPNLDRARLFAEEGNLREAIAAAEKIAPGRALYDEAQTAIQDWQGQIIWNAQIAEDQPILSRAQSLASNGDLAGAIRVASQIGSGRPLYREAQDSIRGWQAQLNPPRREPEPRRREEDWFERFTEPPVDDGSPTLFPETVDPRLLQPGVPSPSSAPVPVESSPFAPLPDRIETLPPATPNIAPPESSPPAPIPPAPVPIEERFPPADASPGFFESPSPAPPEESNLPFNGYYDERFLDGSNSIAPNERITKGN